jgi:hypothetical protein
MSNIIVAYIIECDVFRGELLGASALSGAKRMIRSSVSKSEMTLGGDRSRPIDSGRHTVILSCQSRRLSLFVWIILSESSKSSRPSVLARADP